MTVTRIHTVYGGLIHLSSIADILSVNLLLPFLSLHPTHLGASVVPR